MKYFVSDKNMFAIVNFFKEKNILVSLNDPAFKIAQFKNWNVERISYTSPIVLNQRLKEKEKEKEKKEGKNEKEEENNQVQNSPPLKSSTLITYTRKNRYKTDKEEKSFYELPEHSFSDENLYFWDGTHHIELNLNLRLKNIEVFGGHPICEILENDRLLTKQVFQKLNIPTPPFEVAFSIDEAIQILKKSPFEKAVLKISTVSSSSPIATSIAPPQELASLLEENKALFEKAKNFIIEKFIEGKEISCERYTWKKQTGFFNFTIEAKKFLAGNLGVNTGCQFNLVFPDSLIDKIASLTKNKKEFQKVLYHIKEQLEKTKDIEAEILDINFIIDKDFNIYALEFTPRIGYLGTLSYAKILKDENFYWDYIPDYLEANFNPKLNLIAFGILLTLPPYPYTQIVKDPQLSPKDLYVEIQNFEETREKINIEIAPEGIEYDEDDKCFYSISDHLTSVHSTTTIDNISKLFSSTYSFIKDNIHAPNLQYRSDAENFFVEYFKSF